jgi:MYXO-CTERM domain-containing protein
MQLKPQVFITIFVAAAAFPAAAHAKDFYVDPAKGSMSNDGSAAKPWKTLEEVVAANLIESQTWESLPYTPGAKLVPKNAGAPVKAGDTIYLRDGYHGDVSLTGYYNAAQITVAAESGQAPKLKRVLIRAGQNWLISGLHVSPEFAPTYEPQTMITVESHNFQGPVSDVIIEGCSLRSKEDVSAWTAANWDQLSANGFSIGGKNITVRKNQLKNVNFGISVSATESLVEHNVVDSFAGDGLRGLGDYTVFQYNVVKNCYKVNDNHDDGFQSWSVGPDGVGSGEVKGIVLRGNLIQNYEDPNQPFRGTLQGIGCFDGMFVDWVIENNVIITDHWHGITLLGARNARIVNNTVIDLNDQSPGPPWIMIDDHKNGTKPEGCVVRNNLTTDLNLADTGVVEDHNILLDDLSAFFVNPATFDLHLLENAPAVNAGSSDLAPALDFEGIPRPQGGAVDVGAFEWHDGSVVPAGAGGGGGAGGSSSASASGGASGVGGGDPLPPGQDPGEDGGCGCRVGAAGDPERAALPLVALAAALFMVRRRASR